MGAIFQSLGKTVLAGFVILVLIILVTGGAGARAGDHAWFAFLFRWLHVMAGVMWIGLLWYFNFVQIPSMSKIPDEQKPAIGKVIAPTALFWFRWAALATVITGLIVASMNGYLGTALMFGKPFTAIGIGMWLALIMAFNVWFIIWPNQKKRWVSSRSRLTPKPRRRVLRCWPPASTRCCRCPCSFAWLPSKTAACNSKAAAVKKARVIPGLFCCR